MSLLTRQLTSVSPDFHGAYESTSPELHDAVTRWERGESETITYVDNDGNEVCAPGTVPGGPVKGKPVFQFLNTTQTFADGGTMVAESENCVSFIPAGFRNGPTPNAMNPVREEVGGSSALMSLVHVLTIPKNKRIYNAVTLTREHKPLLQEMKELGEKAVGILLNGPKEMMGSLQWIYAQSGEIEMKDGTKKSLLVTMEDLSPDSQMNFGHSHTPSKLDIRNSFHAYPTASIGWLHLHTYVGDLLTTAHDTMERHAMEEYNCKKNTPFEEIVSTL